MHLMIEQETDEKKAEKLHNQLTGRFRTLGPPIPPEDAHAPDWWKGDEEAYESTMAATLQLSQLRPRR
jgi:hypothetical protein